MTKNNIQTREGTNLNVDTMEHDETADIMKDTLKVVVGKQMEEMLTGLEVEDKSTDL